MTTGDDDRVRVLREVLGVARPIVNAPMAFVAGGALAAAVADAGGLGLIGGGYGDAGWIDEQLDLVGSQQLAAGLVGVGLITWKAPVRLVERLVSRGVRTLCLSFGDPTAHAAAVRDAGVTLLCQVQSVDDAVVAVAAGAHVIVAQGSEAGGHGRPGRSARTLLQDLSRCEDLRGVPLVVAGGATNGRDVRRAIGWGAGGVMAGTRFYATHEAIDLDAAKRLLVSADARDSVRTTVFDVVRGPAWPRGYDGRALRNRMVERWEEAPDDLVADLQAERHRYRAAARVGDLDRRAVWAGRGVGRIRSIESVATVMDDLATGLARR